MDVVLLGQCVHYVQQRQEPRAFHRHPSNSARDIEVSGRDRRLAHAIPFNAPLKAANLSKVSLFPVQAKPEMAQEVVAKGSMIRRTNGKTKRNALQTRS